MFHNNLSKCISMNKAFATFLGRSLSQNQPVERKEEQKLNTVLQANLGIWQISKSLERFKQQNPHLGITFNFLLLLYPVSECKSSGFFLCCSHCHLSFTDLFHLKSRLIKISYTCVQSQPPLVTLSGEESDQSSQDILEIKPLFCKTNKQTNPPTFQLVFTETTLVWCVGVLMNVVAG